MKKMREDVKKAWVEALRSGEFEQGQGELHNEKANTYCCLGVLQKIRKCRAKHPDSEFLPPTTLETFQLEHETQERLADFNDKGRSFRWIASYIERYL